MDAQLLATLVGGGAAGSVITILYNRWRDRSSPRVSVLRLATASRVPDAARDLLMRFPPSLASRYNAHPVTEGRLDSAKEIPLSSYAEQLHAAREAVRVNHIVQENQSETFETLFRMLDRQDQIGFIKAFAENNSFLWSWIGGRAKRGETPPHPPQEVVEVASLHAKPALRLYTDQDGDYVINLVGTVHRVLLIWSSVKSPDIREQCRKAASGVFRDLVEFRTDSLRELLGCVARDVGNSRTELWALLQDIDVEERRLSFLEVSAILRNLGRRPCCVEPRSTLFVLTGGFTFTAASGTQRTIVDDVRIELSAQLGHGQPQNSVNGNRPDCM